MDTRSVPQAKHRVPTQPTLAEQYRAVRATTMRLCEPLELEDYQLQSMPDASPPKWQLAHTTWFFETFVLAEFEADFRPFHPQFGFLFNSYYEAVGERWPRGARGLLSRPTVAEVQRYRREIDARMLELLERTDVPALTGIVELGLNHEQQHQELLLTDLKHAFGLNPMRPVYCPSPQMNVVSSTAPLRWHDFPAGVCSLGHAGAGFAFDNELPRHRIFLEGFQLASRLVTAGEYLGFMNDGGYHRPELWLADGWAAKKQHGWQAPLYWHQSEQSWSEFTLHGVRPLEEQRPVCHVSFYEADAFARWAEARLPTEGEWETAVEGRELAGNFLESGALHPLADTGHGQFYGDVWEWTASPYTAYPGYRPAAGAVGEYNGKFMCNQMILRGGSCATPASHIRSTYRNFFSPEARWQFSGLRLAKSGI